MSAAGFEVQRAAIERKRNDIFSTYSFLLVKKQKIPQKTENITFLIKRLFFNIKEIAKRLSYRECSASKV